MSLSNHLLDIIDDVNSTSLPMNTFVLSFDIVNILHNIDKSSGLDAGKYT